MKIIILKKYFKKGSQISYMIITLQEIEIKSHQKWKENLYVHAKRLELRENRP